METKFVTREQLIMKMDELIKHLDAPFSVAVLDLDSFSGINKTFGTRIGDEIIKKIESILSQNTSDIDAISRHGDEFVILLVKKGAERSFMEMEEIRRYLSENTFTFTADDKKEDVYVTFSCGIASCPRDAKNVVELFRVADSALFRAKKLGKNKVCLSEAESMVLKSSYLTKTQVDRLAALSKETEKTEAYLIREAIDELFKKYSK